MDFQPWPNKIIPVCPNPHSLSELTSLLIEWGFEHDILETNLTDNSYQVAATVDPHPDIASLWGHLIATFPELGFWPVHTDGSLDELFDPDPDRIGTAEEFFAENTMPLFENHWEQGWEAPDFPELTPERLRSFADFHTRTIRTEPTINTEKSHVVDDKNLSTTQLLITPVPRPADVPATIGWPGAINYDYSGAGVSTVLRSWEDRFGALLTSLNFAEMDLRISNVAQLAMLTHDELVNLTLEHYVFCPDSLDQGTLRFPCYLNAISGSPLWPFWSGGTSIEGHGVFYHHAQSH